jgi:hypothetical protein
VLYQRGLDAIPDGLESRPDMRDRDRNRASA